MSTSNTETSPANTESSKTTPKAPREKKERKLEVVIATAVLGQVKWFSVKSGYGFINHAESNEDVFVHSKGIKYNNPRKLYKTLAEGESVEFDIVKGEKGLEAINVTGPNGRYVQGSQYAANRTRSIYARQAMLRNRRAAKDRKNKVKRESNSDDLKKETKESPVEGKKGTSTAGEKKGTSTVEVKKET